MTNIPSEMSALAIMPNEKRLMQATKSVPQPKADEVLIKVAYAGINRADLFQIEGTYPAPDDVSADVPGLEVSGEIVTLGESVREWHIGDAVCALLSGGGYAEYVTVPGGQCLPLPGAFSMAEAASLPEAWATAWMALVHGAQIQEGEALLIHGGSSGVGTAAIQLAKYLGASSVFVTAGSAEKCALCESLGAIAINYREHDFVNTIKEHTGGRAVDVVIDIVGGEYIQRNIKVMNVGGRMISLAFLQGVEVSLRAGALLLKNLSWQGMTLRSLSNAQKTQIMRALQQAIWPEIALGNVKPVIDQVVPMADISQAHERMHNYLHSGKIVVDMQQK